jgi:hypothetical protein
MRRRVFRCFGNSVRVCSFSFHVLVSNKEKRAMKRLLVLGAFVLLACAANVNAATINIDSKDETFNTQFFATWDNSTNATYDIVKIYVQSIGGDKVGQTIQAIEGKWMATGGQFCTEVGAGTNAAFQSYTTATGLLMDRLMPTVYTYSGINFTGTAAGDIWGRQAGTDGIVLTNMIAGAWEQGGAVAQNLSASTADTDSDVYPENLLGQFYVTKGTTAITYGGVNNGMDTKISYSGNGSVAAVEIGSFSIRVPEPTSVALLGCGLFGLLAYAWRKRK